MTTVSDRNVTRIPNLHMGEMVDEKGYPTDDESTFRQVLITNLQRLFGNEGVVLPSLTTAEINAIQNNVDIGVEIHALMVRWFMTQLLIKLKLQLILAAYHNLKYCLTHLKEISWHRIKCLTKH